MSGYSFPAAAAMWAVGLIFRLVMPSKWVSVTADDIGLNPESSVVSFVVVRQNMDRTWEQFVIEQNFPWRRDIFLVSYAIGDASVSPIPPKVQLLNSEVAARGRTHVSKDFDLSEWRDKKVLPVGNSGNWIEDEADGYKPASAYTSDEIKALDKLGFAKEAYTHRIKSGQETWYTGVDLETKRVQVCGPSSGVFAETTLSNTDDLILDTRNNRLLSLEWTYGLDDQPERESMTLTGGDPKFPKQAMVWNYKTGKKTTCAFSLLTMAALNEVAR